MTTAAGELVSPTPHPLHAAERDWTETNCYVDLWIEVLHSVGLEPRAAFACTLSADFLGDQWSFLKPPGEDLRALWGIQVDELNVWRPVLDHIEEQLGWARLLTVEVDAWWLPDTRGTSYHRAHGKTTIVPRAVNRAERELEYFHGSSLFTLSGSDFDGVFCAPALPPYVELIRLDRLRGSIPPETPLMLARDHLLRRPEDNPVERLATRLLADLDWLRSAGSETFHEYAFGVLRQFGSTAQLAADHLGWLATVEPTVGAFDAGLGVVAFRDAARQAKAVQFGLARLLRGRDVDPRPGLAAMGESWGAAVAHAADSVGLA